MKQNIKITYLCHACLLLEIDGTRIITDPWLVGPCWADNIWQYPPALILPEEISDIDYIYISHGHEDHLHSETLKRINPEVKSKAKIIVPDFGKPYFKKALIANGLTNIVFIQNESSIYLSNDIKATIFNCDAGDDDSSLLIETKEGNIFMQTDNLMTSNLAKKIGGKYDIDIAFVMTSRTGIFPGFYELEIDKLRMLAEKKSKKSYEIVTAIIKGLKPNYVLPYASDLCYLGELYYMNFFHRNSKHNFVKYVKDYNFNFETVILGPNDEIKLLDKKLTKTKIAVHDFDGNDLPLFGYQKRHEVYKYQKEEKKYNEKEITKDIEFFINKINIASDKWSHKSYKVLWQIDTIENGIIYLDHQLPNNIKHVKSIREDAYDLKLYIQGYRLQRLVRGDYKMGFMTLHNGSIYVDRDNKEFTELESLFWKWAFLETKFNLKSQ